MSHFVETPVSTPNYIPKRLGTRTPLDVEGGGGVGGWWDHRYLRRVPTRERARAWPPRIESLSLTTGKFI